ncbi:MAG TPA: prepilin-type N-terminal cleavage/methylation domain-containing protein [Nitrospirae bacterium]|nr:putative major pilin subunit [bacterium BMS3Abin06]HDH10814.1 prepilin-type N-terminal cleavage/methylation domain-containing protein [Nitrospirota bacterium]HDZ00942.1 prepilin-type N-terminal cleavage/methylation domain-containing protein [Nitrospirota bacterium]
MRSLFLNNKDRGFTLSELLITMAILSLLAGIAVPIYLGQRSKAAHSEAKANLEAIRLFEEQRFAENGSYGANSTTYLFTEAVSSLQSLLPGFRPGNAANLNFDYQLVVGGTGTTFTATATGKSSSVVDGATFSIDNNNNRSGF